MGSPTRRTAAKPKARKPIRNRDKFAKGTLANARLKIRRGDYASLCAAAVPLAASAKGGLFEQKHIRLWFVREAIDNGVKRSEAERAFDFGWGEAETYEFVGGEEEDHSSKSISLHENYLLSLHTPGSLDNSRVGISNPDDGPSDFDRAFAVAETIKLTGELAQRWRKEKKPERRMMVARILMAFHQVFVVDGGYDRFRISYTHILRFCGLPDNRSTREAIGDILVRLHKAGYLSRLYAGEQSWESSGKCAEYQWHEPPISGNATWKESDNVWEGFPQMEVYKAAADILPNVVGPADLEPEPKLASVARAMIALSRASDAGPNKPFRASYIRIASLAGIKGDDARKSVKSLLGTLRHRGYVSLVKLGRRSEGGADPRPSEWIWHNPRIPGQTTWAEQRERYGRGDHQLPDDFDGAIEGSSDLAVPGYDRIDWTAPGDDAAF